jgi:hypothetical protein
MPGSGARISSRLSQLRAQRLEPRGKVQKLGNPSSARPEAAGRRAELALHIDECMTASRAPPSSMHAEVIILAGRTMDVAENKLVSRHANWASADILGLLIL